MGIKVMAEALVTYACYLSDEDSNKVIKYAKDNKVSLEEAVEKLYWGSEDTIDLYQDSVESDLSTEDITSVEIEDDSDE